MPRTSYLKFDTAVSDHFGSNNTAIAFARLLYWFGKKPDGFYKFKEACKHPLYKQGDSWSEDLKMTKRILDPILKRLVTHHISKNAYRESQDKFAGKMFCSYTERNTNRTFYFMDRVAVEQFLSSIGLTSPLPSSNVKSKPMEVDVVSGEAKNMPSEKPSTPQNVVPLTCARLTAFNTHTITSLPREEHTGASTGPSEVSEAEADKVKLSSKKMIELWNSHTQDEVVWYPSTALRLFRVLADFFGGCLEAFSKYCSSIASSKFLMGKAPNSRFKAFFYWVIKPEVIQSIFKGAYGVEGIFSKTGVSADSQEEMIKNEPSKYTGQAIEMPKEDYYSNPKMSPDEALKFIRNLSRRTGENPVKRNSNSYGYSLFKKPAPKHINPNDFDNEAKIAQWKAAFSNNFSERMS